MLIFRFCIAIFSVIYILTLERKYKILIVSSFNLFFVNFYAVKKMYSKLLMFRIVKKENALMVFHYQKQIILIKID